MAFNLIADASRTLWLPWSHFTLDSAQKSQLALSLCVWLERPGLLLLLLLLLFCCCCCSGGWVVLYTHLALGLDMV